MSMLYRPLVRLPASRGRPEPPGAPLCEAPARARNTRLLEVESDRSRAALRHRPLLPPCQRYPGDSCWPCQQLKHLRPTRRSSSQSGVQKPVGNEWRRWVKLEWLTRFSSETSSKCSGIDPDGLWSISAKEKPGRRHHLTCLEVDQLLERRTRFLGTAFGGSQRERSRFKQCMKTVGVHALFQWLSVRTSSQLSGSKELSTVAMDPRGLET